MEISAQSTALLFKCGDQALARFGQVCGQGFGVDGDPCVTGDIFEESTVALIERRPRLDGAGR